MLQALRDKTSGWIATVILGLLIIPFAFFGMESYLSQKVDTYAARIAQPPSWWPSAPQSWPLTLLWKTHDIDAQDYRQRLETELAARRALAEKLIHTEEDTRKSLARELHDEIGQNITAIQIQSQLVKRARDPAQTQAAASQINDLARRIHHSTRQLLRQLRPPALDELSFKEALHHLLNEFAFAERGIRCRFDYRLTATPESETVRFTLYRLLQELLNNVCKHADASEVAIALFQQGALLRLEVKDNGIGLRADQMAGFGIQGMRERVSALGGELTLESQRGTRVIVNLPTNLQQTAG